MFDLDNITVVSEITMAVVHDRDVCLSLRCDARRGPRDIASCGSDRCNCCVTSS